jgi:glycosyltransferase involved in cell wall biosynthesis
VPTACLVSFRLGGGDGVAIEATKWAAALGVLGWDVFTVAGSGPVDVAVPGLAMDAAEGPSAAEVTGALAGADLVVVENLCSLPLNLAASAVVAAVCAGRPTVLHHHDLPWQRPHLAHLPAPPDDPAWAHVTINELSRRELAARGFHRRVTTLYNTFDPDPAPGDRVGLRRAFGLADSDLLLLQPTRALARKNVPAAVALAEAVGGVYWLLGPAEDGFGPELDRIVERAECRVILGVPPGGCSVADAYGACDAVLLPSSWEGFGNPSVESATHRRPLAIGPYPVAAELAAFGFRWFDALDPSALAGWLAAPDASLLEHNHRVAARSFNVADLPERLSRVLNTLPGLSGGGGAPSPWKRSVT